MEDGEYRVTRGDKIHRTLSIVLLLILLGYLLTGLRPLYLWRGYWASLVATAFVWFPDYFGIWIGFRNASTYVRVLGWILLLIPSVVHLLLSLT